MGKVGIAFPNRFDGTTLSGGNWTTGLPSERLLTKQIADVARTINARPRSSYLWVTMSEAKEAGICALVGSNITTAGEIRLRGYTNDPRPALDIDFTNATLDSRITFTRTSSGTYVDEDGLLQTAGNNVARFEWLNGVCLGLLIEESRTNIVLHNSDLTNAAWTKTSMSTSKTATGPDGQANSATICTAAAGNATVLQSITSASATRATTAYVRRRTGTGTVEMTQNGGTLWTAIAVTAGWTRVSIPSATITNPSVGFRIVTNGDAIDVAYVQCETGALPTSAIATTTVSATRQADVASITGADFTDFYTPNAGTFTVGFQVSGAQAGVRSVISALQDSNNYIGMQIANGSLDVSFVVQQGGGGAEASLINQAITANTPHRISGAFAPDDFAASLDGGAVDTDTSGPTLPAPSTLYLGRSPSGTVYLNGIIDSVSFHPARRSNADLQALASDDWSVAADYDSGAVDAWDSTYLAATTAEARDGLRNTPTIIPTSPQTYRYWRIDIDDDTNTDGYIELGRVFMGSLWQPGINMVYGASLHYEPRDQVSETRSGAEYFDELNGYRVARFRLQAATEGEAVLTLMRMQRQLGSSGELFFVWDDDDTTYAPERTFLGRMRALSPITAARWSEFEAEFDIKELL